MRLLILLLSLLPAAPCFAWGELGHEVVGELAERRLSPAARAEVRTLLADEVEPTLAGVATWADAVRGLEAFRWTSPLHYVNIRDRGCRFVARRDCRGDECVVGAIQRYARRLGDRSLQREQRAEALKFLVHFVGDVHQPLHAGRRPDKGGNAFQISLAREGREPQGTSLHGVWDYFLLAASGESRDAYTARLAADLPPVETPGFVAGDAVRWAESSCALTDREGFYPRRPGRLDPAYFDAMRPLAEQRLVAAAVELARTIETALAMPPLSR